MSSQSPSKYLEIALGVHRWLESQRINTDVGISWQSHSRFPDPQSTIYYGAGGIALFYLELYERTGRSEFLEIAGNAADGMVARLPRELQPVRRHNASYKDMRVDLEPGLYFGVTGVGYVLTEVAKRTGSAAHRDGALKCIDLLSRAARETNGGISWSEVRDVTTGSAGIGLGLLYLARAHNSTVAKDLAIAAGSLLIQQGIEDKGGLRWEWEKDELRHHANFAHGTSGTAYFLLELYRLTGDTRFMRAVEAGARYLAAVTPDDGLICLSFNEFPNIHYLGWCHGPVGTGRFYYLLWETTHDERWLLPLFRAAEGIRKTGIPETPAPGLWNNVGICCGSAGLVEYFLHLYVMATELGRGDAQAYLEFAKRVARDIAAHATVENGLSWRQAEHRVLPDLVVAQTGYMQGASGVGVAFLYLDLLADSPPVQQMSAIARRHITLPDAPFFRANP